MRRPALALLLAAAAPASAEVIGECRFDRDTLTFARSQTEQATCLLRKVKLLGEKEARPLAPVIAHDLDAEVVALVVVLNGHHQAASITVRQRQNRCSTPSKGKKPRWRNGVHWAVNFTAPRASGQPSRGTGLA